uniref:Uncharacterized protein n=1 Tax=Timema cristinae TaxID=61476 RepID=A0A7R9H1V6_TIMCR|nr:unnamed protein product [Timema cristinae]
MWCRTVLVASCVACITAQFQYYTVPEPTIQALKPKGLRVSIPVKPTKILTLISPSMANMMKYESNALDIWLDSEDEPGIELFAFHGNVNKPMEGLEGGHMSKDIIKAKNGRWVFEDLRVRLKVGDIIYFWLYVQVDGLGYRRDDQKFTVKELVGEGPQPDPTPVNPVTPEPTLPATCGSTLTTVNGGPTCQGKLIFEDNFDGLDISKWQYDVRIAGSPNNEFVAYTKSPENCYTQNGILRVKPSLLADTKDLTKDSLVLDGCTGLPDSAECTKKAIAWDILPPVLSSRLQSKQTFSFCYGKVEVRAKLPAGDWIYPEYMTFSVDGQQFAHISPSNTGFASLSDFSSVRDNPWLKGSNIAPFDKEFYLSLGLGVGGIGDFPDNCSTSLPSGGFHPKPWKNTGAKAKLTFWQDKKMWYPTWDGENSALQVDYVKVWAL